jgi:putative endonuclease
MPDRRQQLGRWGEAQAIQYLAQRGYSILQQNARTSYGEIDIVARQTTVQAAETTEVTVFIEVKTRTSGAYGYPEQAVNARKQAHLLAAAQAYLQEHPALDGDWRVDVVAVEKPASGPVQITHFEDAVHAAPE